MQFLMLGDTVEVNKTKKTKYKIKLDNGYLCFEDESGEAVKIEVSKEEVGFVYDEIIRNRPSVKYEHLNKKLAEGFVNSKVKCDVCGEYNTVMSEYCLIDDEDTPCVNICWRCIELGKKEVDSYRFGND